MSERKTGEVDVAAGCLPAGDFSAWLGSSEALLRSGKGAAEVPCGSCRGCCRSSMFVHIKPEETQTIRRIPRALLFPAPGLPKGHVLLGYRDNGACPMLLENKCSIYEDRPQTCRDYDCRVFAATGVQVDLQTQAEIANRVKAWEFTYESEEGRQEHLNLKRAAAFLEENRDLFPPGSLPSHPAQLAACAIGIYRVFSGITAGANENAVDIPSAAIVHAIMTALSQAQLPLKSEDTTKKSGSKRKPDLSPAPATPGPPAT